MKKTVMILATALSLFASDVLVKESCVSVDATTQNIKNILKKKGITLFTIVDHGQNAKDVKLGLGESKLIIFGNAKLGTLFMQKDKKLGLDLPLKILVYKDEDKKVKMAYRDGSNLGDKRQKGTLKNIETVNNAMHNITTKASQCLKD